MAPKDRPKPEPIALVLCDNVYQEKAGKQALVGLFNRIRARSFPVHHPKMCVFVSITDLWPNTVCKLDIVHGETEELVVSMEGPMPKEAGPTAVCELVFELQNLVFKEAGTYFVRFFGNDQVLMQRRFELTQEGN